jgi:hypothetical protein
MKKIFLCFIMLVSMVLLAPAMYAATGEGVAAISPATVASGATAASVYVTYTAGSTAWSNGMLQISIPAGWSAPSKAALAKGYVQVAVANGTVSSFTVSDSRINIYVTSLTATIGEIYCYYGNGTNKANVPTATSSRYDTFTVSSHTNGNSPYPISTQVSIQVVGAATRTQTSTLTVTLTPTLTKTPTATPVSDSVTSTPPVWNREAWEGIKQTNIVNTFIASGTPVAAGTDIGVLVNFTNDILVTDICIGVPGALSNTQNANAVCILDGSVNTIWAQGSYCTKPYVYVPKGVTLHVVSRYTDPYWANIKGIKR